MVKLVGNGPGRRSLDTADKRQRFTRLPDLMEGRKVRE
jgi:hypothetical protein